MSYFGITALIYGKNTPQSLFNVTHVTNYYVNTFSYFAKMNQVLHINLKVKQVLSTIDPEICCFHEGTLIG